MTGALFGGSNGENQVVDQQASPAPYQSYQQPMSEQQQQNPCQYELQQFVECAQNQRDISLCQGFNEVLRQCKLSHGGYSILYMKLLIKCFMGIFLFLSPFLLILYGRILSKIII